jgi:hypothetical protein
MSLTRAIADFVWGAAMVWAIGKSLPARRQSICTSPWALAASAVTVGAIYAALTAWR